MKTHTITIAHGNGIGPEIMEAVLRVLREAGARLDCEPIAIGEEVYKRGINTGIEPSAWESLRRTGVFLKAPVTTPQGGGFKSLNVTIRKAMGLYANIRPTMAYAPFVATRHPRMDVVIVRENEEDVYGGIEYRQTRDMTQCLKLISEPGCDRVIRAAFEFAVRQGRKKVTCFSKDNIMKITDGLFRRTFDRIAADYPAIETDHYIVDIGAARLADTPEKFDVIVMPNLYGDILSDVAAQIAGSVGLAGSANIGQTGAMFEAIHGSAPDIAGRDIANPSGLLMGSVLMLVHLGETQLAETIQNAWLRTIEDGIHTADIVSREQTKQQVGTRAFAQAVVERLGQKPHSLKAAAFARAASTPTPARPDNAGIVKSLVGVDLYFDGFGRIQDGTKFVETVAPLIGDEWKISSLSNRGTRVWPEGIAETFCVDHWCLRLRDRAPTNATAGRIAALLGRLAQSGWDVVKTENLYTFDGKNGFSSDGRE